MKFDVFRDSSYHEGRDPSATDCPIDGAVFNVEESRWELEVTSLEGLMGVLDRLEHPVALVAACPDCGDLPVMNILDAPLDELESSEDVTNAASLN